MEHTNHIQHNVLSPNLVIPKTYFKELDGITLIKTRKEIDEYIAKHKIKLLIFDCDGTLIDTLGWHYESWNDAYNAFDHKFISKANFLEHFAGTSGHEMIAYLNKVSNTNLDAKKVTKIKHDIFLDKYILQAKPIKPVLDIALYYHHLGLKLAVASGGQRVSVTNVLANNNILGLFTDIITIEDVKQGKPSPELFHSVADRNNIEHSSCLVFEDTEQGFVAAKRANMEFVDIRLLQNLNPIL